mmetsp:Transcript_17188/g.38716  ORF Transcript_17188/g.38716 Transcript_17188/m.38716 type:complete len:183 (-) Transcript_17188:1370-1918(-)
MKHSIAAARTPHAAAALRTGMALDMLVAWPTTKSPRLDHRSREGQGCEEENSVPQGTTEQRHSLNRGRRSPLLGANANSADSFDIVFKPGVLDERRGWFETSGSLDLSYMSILLREGKNNLTLTPDRAIKSHHIQWRRSRTASGRSFRGASQPQYPRSRVICLPESSPTPSTTTSETAAPFG